MNKENVMIDLETLGTSKNALILSFAAVRFDIETGQRLSSVQFKIDPESCEKVGLKIDASTVFWWLRQKKEAQIMLVEAVRTPLEEALMTLHLFINRVENTCVWGNGATFDLSILANAYEACGLPVPWAFFNERDVRTLVSLNPQIKYDTKFMGVPHDALHDCLHQIEYCSKIYKSLKTK